MLSEDKFRLPIQVLLGVLILVLMEYALWGQSIKVYRDEDAVLILVLMEYALWDRVRWTER